MGLFSIGNHQTACSCKGETSGETVKQWALNVLFVLGIKLTAQGQVLHTKLGWNSAFRSRLGWLLWAYGQEMTPAAGHRACAGWTVGGSTPEPKGTCQQRPGVTSLFSLTAVWSLKLPSPTSCFGENTIWVVCGWWVFFVCVWSRWRFKQQRMSFLKELQSCGTVFEEDTENSLIGT